MAWKVDPTHETGNKLRRAYRRCGQLARRRKSRHYRLVQNQYCAKAATVQDELACATSACTAKHIPLSTKRVGCEHELVEEIQAKAPAQKSEIRIRQMAVGAKHTSSFTLEKDEKRHVKMYAIPAHESVTGAGIR